MLWKGESSDLESHFCSAENETKSSGYVWVLYIGESVLDSLQTNSCVKNSGLAPGFHGAVKFHTDSKQTVQDWLCMQKGPKMSHNFCEKVKM